MGFYSGQIVPRLVNKVMADKEFEPIRARVTAGLDGEVVEIGFGSGLNVPHYPPAVRRVQAVDPATLGRKLATRRLAAAPVPVEFVGLDGQRLPLDSGSADHVLATWTLCSIPDPGLALAEIQRVLRPGGAFHFVEHGRHPDPRVARWQDRLEGPWRFLGDGCHCNRDTVATLRDSPLRLGEFERGALPKAIPIVRPLISGTATL